MALSDVRLGTVLESVEADVADGLVYFRVVVPECLLRDHFGADETTQSWLQAFRSNASVIEREALENHKASGQSTVILFKVSGPSQRASRRAASWSIPAT